MIVLLGSGGYVGQAFAAELRRRGHGFIPLTRKAINYADFTLLFDYVRKVKPQFIINAAVSRASRMWMPANWLAKKLCLPTPCFPRPLPAFAP